MLRALKSLVHLGSALMVTWLLSRVCDLATAALGGAWFLLWCCNPEATIWRSGGPYVIAVALAFGAAVLRELHLGRVAAVVAATLTALAVLSNQAAAMAGIT